VLVHTASRARSSKLPEPGQIAVDEAFRVGPPLGSADGGGQRHEHHLDQVVVPAAIDPWNGKLFKSSGSV
jgi:hypothetical protein